jgi:hypothetical protein
MRWVAIRDEMKMLDLGYAELCTMINKIYKRATWELVQLAWVEQIEGWVNTRKQEAKRDNYRHVRR